MFELFDECGFACTNFKMLCSGDGGVGRSGKPLCYKSTPIHRIVPGFVFQGGDITHFDGRGGESLFNFGKEFEDEIRAEFKHAGPGYLAMANSGPNTNKSQFYVTFVKTEWLDGNATVFGRLVEGHWMLKEIEACGNPNGDGSVINRVAICDSGIYDPVKEAEKLAIEQARLASLPKIFDDQNGVPDPYDPDQAFARSMYREPSNTLKPLPLESFEKKF